MKSHLFSSDEDENGVPKSAFYWWRTLDEFDENGHFKVVEVNSSSLTPRIRVLREMERLAFVAGEGLDDVRHKLLSYRAGDFWLPIGGIKKEEMEMPDVITLVLTGLSSSGKSSLVNLMYSVLGRSGLTPFAQTSGGSSNHTTMYLEEHNVLRSPRSGFCIYDTRGLDEDQIEDGLEEVSWWMADGVRHCQPCQSAGDEKPLIGPSNPRYIKRKVNYVMVVADLSQIHRAFKCGDLKPVEALKELFHFPPIKNSNENPILILTHGDTLHAEDRINGRLMICEYLGIPEASGAYDVPCLTEQGILAEEYDPVTAFALTEAVYRALLQSDRAHVPKRKFKDWLIFFFYWLMWFLASVFGLLANFFSRFVDHDKRLKTRSTDDANAGERAKSRVPQSYSSRVSQLYKRAKHVLPPSGP